MTRQSGKWRGKAFIQGGRKFLREALYTPALMRKLIELANALIKADRKWSPNSR